ncbi:HTH_Tnp_Tc3_2 domain-containing protein [Trichonephila clavipes]|nr:HTH_Tnp_Tc3_2 domain-containing protein [Trichonephila clavipes]
MTDLSISLNVIECYLILLSIKFHKYFTKLRSGEWGLEYGVGLDHGKDELKIVAEELNLTVPEGAKIAGLKNLIVNSDVYKNDKELVQSAIDYALAEIKNKRLDSEIKLEFERIKLAQLQKQLELANIQKNLIENSDIQNPSVCETAANINVETLLKVVKTLTIPVPSRVESYNLFFQSLEKAFKIKEVPEQFKCEILLNILGERVNNLLVHVSEEELNNYSLREAGWSNRRIGRHLGRSDMVVARCWQQWITEGRVYRRGGSGRPRNTNDREDRAIRRVATSAPTTSLASIQRHLPPFQTSSAIKRNHKETTDRSWLEEPTVTDWRRVIFSDESRFSLSDDDHRTRVWRRTGQRSDPAFIVERHTAISQGVTVWGAISWDTRSSLVVLQGTLTARRYVDDILTPIVLPMLSSRPGAIYQQDNARPHTARLSQQCLQGYDVLPWPARSPDLSPIEHVWTRWEGNCSRPEIQEN